MNDFKFTREHTNAVKAVAAIAILFHHLFIGMSAEWNMDFDIVPVLRLANFSKVGVAVFVFLSAFGLTKSWNAAAMKSEGSIRNLCGVWVTERYIKLMSSFWFVYILAMVITSFTSRTPAAVFGNEAMPLLAVLADFFGVANFLGLTLLNETWWYMSLAIVVVISVPFLVAGERKFGIALLLLMAMIPNYVLQAYSVPADNILPAILGVFCAQNDVLERIHQKRITQIAGIDVLLKLVLSIWSIWILYNIRMYYGRAYIVDGSVAFLLAVGIMEFCEIPWLKWLKYVLNFIGRHSMNIFLVHTFIFSYYFSTFIYSFRQPLPILGVLLVFCLLISMVIEWLKRVICYDYFMGEVQKKLLKNNK